MARRDFDDDGASIADLVSPVSGADISTKIVSRMQANTALGGNMTERQSNAVVSRDNAQQCRFFEIGRAKQREDQS